MATELRDERRESWSIQRQKFPDLLPLLSSAFFYLLDSVPESPRLGDGTNDPKLASEATPRVSEAEVPEMKCF